MFTFAIKKSFFDAWDNMGTTALSNLGLLVMILIAAMLPGVIFLIPFISVGCGVVSVIMMHVADGQRAEWLDVPAGLKSSWKGESAFWSGYSDLSYDHGYGYEILLIHRFPGGGACRGTYVLARFWGLSYRNVVLCSDEPAYRRFVQVLKKMFYGYAG